MRSTSGRWTARRRSARTRLELHHIVRRVDGGSHDAGNLCLLCSSCHISHHNGLLAITGTAEQIEVRRHGAPGSSAQATRGIGVHAESRVSADARPAMGAHVGANARAGAHAGPRDSADEEVPASSGNHLCATVRAEADAGTGAHVGASTRPDFAMPASTDANVGDDKNARVGAHADLRVSATAEVPVSTGAHVRTPVRAGVDAGIGGHVGAPNRLDLAVRRTQAKEALLGLGWKSAIAAAAVAAAIATAGADLPIERLIFEALRRCPSPSS